MPQVSEDLGKGDFLTDKRDPSDLSALTDNMSNNKKGKGKGKGKIKNCKKKNKNANDRDDSSSISSSHSGSRSRSRSRSRHRSSSKQTKSPENKYSQTINTSNLPELLTNPTTTTPLPMPQNTLLSSLFEESFRLNPNVHKSLLRSHSASNIYTFSDKATRLKDKETYYMKLCISSYINKAFIEIMHNFRFDIAQN